MYEDKIREGQKNIDFQCMGEQIQTNESNEEINKGRTRKLELACKLTQNRNNKRAKFYKPRVQYYNTVVKPERLHGSMCLVLDRKEE